MLVPTYHELPRTSVCIYIVRRVQTLCGPPPSIKGIHANRLHEPGLLLATVAVQLKGSVRVGDCWDVMLVQKLLFSQPSCSRAPPLKDVGGPCLALLRSPRSNPQKTATR